MRRLIAACMLAEVIGRLVTGPLELPADAGHALTSALGSTHAILGGFLIWAIGVVWPTLQCRSSPVY